MITLTYQGGLGNQFWQYAVGRILSRKLGLMFVSEGIPGFLDCPKIVFGKINLKEKLILQGHHLPIELRPQRLHMNGYFERYEHVSEFMDEIKTWYTPKLEKVYVESDALTVSIRRGTNNWPVDILCPKKEYYLNKIAELGFNRHYICTDSPDDPFIQDLSREFSNCTVIRSDALSQFNFIQNSKNIFMSPSTFSWWAAMTGSSEQVFWPQIPALNFTDTEYDWFPKEIQKVVLV